MAYTYTPFDYQRAATPKYDSYMGGYQVGYGHPLSTNQNEGYIQNLFPWQQEQAQKESTAFQNYAENQFKGLFDVVNADDPNPLKGFAQTPSYSPYSGTRADFTTHTPSYYNSDQDHTYPARDTFDSQGYLDAQLGNINNYLGGLSSFLGNMSGDDASAAVRQGEIQRAMQRASLPQMPTMQPMQQSIYTGGGWGQASPTWQMGNMTQRQQAPAGILGTTNRGLHGGILGGQQGV